MECQVGRCDQPDEQVKQVFWRGHEDGAFLYVCWFHRELLLPEWR